MVSQIFYSILMCTIFLSVSCSAIYGLDDYTIIITNKDANDNLNAFDSTENFDISDDRQKKLNVPETSVFPEIKVISESQPELKNCSLEGWCPIKFSELSNINLQRIWGSNKNDMWFVGETGAIVHWNGSEWTMTRIRANSLYGIWGSDAKNIWAVGTDGAILQWNGTEWKFIEHYATKNTLKAIWGVDAKNIWAVGQGGTIVHWDGTEWKEDKYKADYSLLAIWGSDANNVWAAGDKNTLLYWNGTAWTKLTLPNVGTNQSSILGLWGTSSTNVWAVLPNTALHWDGTKWNVDASFSSISIYQPSTIWGLDANNIWVVDSREMARWNGTKWKKQSRINNSFNHDLWGTEAKNMWAVGRYGALSFRALETWFSVTNIWNFILDKKTFRSAWNINANGGWVVGDRGEVFRWLFENEDPRWESYTDAIRTDSDLHRIWGADAQNVWTVGSNGIIQYWNGSLWSAERKGNQTLFGLHGLNAQTVWAVGEAGTILYRDATKRWTPKLSGTTETLRSVWTISAMNALAVGTQGTILRWNGTQWNPEANAVKETLMDVCVNEDNTAWAVSEQGSILQGVNGTWSPAYKANAGLQRIWCSSSKEVRAVGNSGLIVRWNGTTWQVEPTNTNESFCAIGGTSKDVWVMSETGLHMRWLSE